MRAGVVRSVLRGAAAGAAGTTALDAVTYLDMSVRGRPASSTPTDTIERVAEAAHVGIPGDEDTRQNRLAGLAPLAGIATGVAVGALLGAVRAAGWRPGPVVGAVAATTVALVGANGPMAVLGITDPRSWSRADWLSDLVPHVAFGAVTAAVLDGLDDGN